MRLFVVQMLSVMTVACVLPPVRATAMTVRTKGDLRLWETVTDRASPLAWPWEADADTATLTFSNRLTHAVTVTNVVRTAGAARGACDHPVTRAADEGLVDALLIQLSNGTELVRATAELAYAPGAAGQPITVRTKASRDWHRVRTPRLAAFDAAWWDVAGPSGYEVLWATPAGPHRVVREFDGAGVVDETVLKFGLPGLLLLVR